MKILVFSSLAYSLVNFRGALLTRMCEEGHEVVAAAPDRDDETAVWLQARRIRLMTIPMDRAGVKPLQDIQTLWGYIRLIMAEKPDLILAYTQKPIIYGGIAARIMGNVPFFVLMSGLGYLFSPDGAKPSFTRSLFLRLYREAVRKARKIFVFNKDDRADMLAAGIITERHDVVQVPGSGVDTDHFRQQPLPAHGLHFLMIGRLMRDKGVFEFLEAARQISADNPETKFSILGRSETSNPTAISAEELARLRTEYPVEFLNETADVRPHLAQASVFILPSYYREGLPRTILEAMATGRAVITTDLPGCRDPIVDGKNGIIVPPRDIDALAAAMRAFITDENLAVEMGACARAIAERDYDVAKVNAALMALMGLDRDQSVHRDMSSIGLPARGAMIADHL